MPLSAIIAVCANPGAPHSSLEAAKKRNGAGARQNRSRRGSFSTFSGKCPKIAPPGGSRGGSANHLFATCLGLGSHVAVHHSREARPPVTRGRPPVTRVPRGPIFIDFESMWARFCHVFWIDSWSRCTYLPTKK